MVVNMFLKVCSYISNVFPYIPSVFHTSNQFSYISEGVFLSFEKGIHIFREAYSYILKNVFIYFKPAFIYFEKRILISWNIFIVFEQVLIYSEHILNKLRTYWLVFSSGFCFQTGGAPLSLSDSPLTASSMTDFVGFGYIDVPFR